MELVKGFLLLANGQLLLGQSTEGKIANALELFIRVKNFHTSLFPCCNLLIITLIKICATRTSFGLFRPFYYKGHSTGASCSKKECGLAGIHLGAREIYQHRIGQRDQFLWGSSPGSPRKDRPPRWWNKVSKGEDQRPQTIGNSGRERLFLSSVWNTLLRKALEEEKEKNSRGIASAEPHSSISLITRRSNTSAKSTKALDEVNYPRELLHNAKKLLTTEKDHIPDIQKWALEEPSKLQGKL